MDSGKFMNYVFEMVFYRFLSEHEEAMGNPESQELGYYIKPEYSWKSLIDSINCGSFSIQYLEDAINDMVGSSIGYKNEATFKNLFADMNLQDMDLEWESSKRADKMMQVMLRVNNLNLGTDDKEFGIIQEAYIILIDLAQPSNARDLSIQWW